MGSFRSSLVYSFVALCLLISGCNSNNSDSSENNSFIEDPSVFVDGRGEGEKPGVEQPAEKPEAPAVNSRCGDGILEGEEVCDDGNLINGDGCNFVCEKDLPSTPVAPAPLPPNPVCGNGIREGAELCDDGNLVDADGCESDCRLPFCGNGIKDPGESCFAEPLFLNSGNKSHALALADLGDDGKADILVANQNSDSLRFFSNSGDENFAVLIGLGQSVVQVGDNPEFLAVGDINGDGKLDAVTANFTANTVSVLKGQGGGFFEPQIVLAAGNKPRALALSDLDNDQDLDLVVANFGSNDLGVYENKNGGFNAPVKLSSPDMQAPRSVVVADLTGDGRKDILTANRNSQNLTLFTQNANGTFSQAQTLIFGQGNATLQPASVALADLNGDQKTDIVTALEMPGQPNGMVFTFKNLGNGQFGPFFSTSFPVGREPRAMALGDVDGDGKIDAVTANFFSNDVSVLRGVGNGSFAPETRLDSGANQIFIALEDLNGDGFDDIVTANDTSSSEPGDIGVLFSNP